MATPVAAPSPEAPRPSAPPDQPAITGPASLKTVSPLALKRPSTGLLDLRGTGLRAEHRALFFKGRDVAAGLRVVRQRFVDGTLIQVLVQVDEGIATGNYSVALADGQGQLTNVLTFRVNP